MVPVALLSLSAVLLAAPQALPEVRETPLAIVGVDVLSMVEHDGVPELLRDQVVLIRGGRIESVAPATETDLPADAHVVDGRGQFLIPGLVDAHTHTYSAEDFELHLANGITTVWEMSGNPQLLAWREEIASGRRSGPRLYVCGPLLKVQAIPFTDMEVTAGSPAEAKRLVEGMAADGYDFIKVWGPLSSEVLASVAQASAAAGLRVTGHVPADVGLAATLESGLAAVAHVEEYWNKFFDERADPSRLEEAAELTKASGAAVVTTLVTYENIAQVLRPDLGGLTERPELRFIDPARRLSFGPEYNDYRRRFEESASARFAEALAFQLRIARALHEAGVPLLAGTDAGGFQLSLVPGFALHRELELLVEAGLTPFEALRAATSAPGRFLAPDDPFGVIAPGRRADLVLLTRNPLEDVAATRSMAGVVVAGRWFDRDELDRRMEALALRNRRTASFVEAALAKGSAVDAYESAKSADRSDEPLFQESPLILLGFLLFQTGRQGEALELLEVVTRELPDSYGAFFVLGAAALSGGDEESARILLEEVLDRCPEHRQARELLEGLQR